MKQKESAGLAIIYRGMVLLAHTTGRKWWGSYGIPKGGIEPGESRMDAAIRETREEVGLDIPRSMIDPNPRTYVLTSRKYKYTKTVYWYVVEVDDLEQIGMKGLVVPKNRLQLEEVDWAGFMPLAEAKKRAMSSQQQLLTQLVGLGLLESHCSDEIYKPEQRKTPGSMKHVKLFEQFINEANEEILAQGACKNAIFMAQKSVDGLLKKLKSADMVTSVKSKVEVYNRGYELRMDVKYDWKKTSELPEDAQNMIMTLQSAIWIQPESFFESHLVDDGSARIEAKAFKTSLDMPYEEQYPRYIVKSKADIKKVQKEYADLIKSQVEEMTKTLGL